MPASLHGFSLFHICLLSKIVSNGADLHDPFRQP
jgi:hypothetical protein